MREFNTSGPNIAKRHYTIERKELIEKGRDLVEKERYFTIWAPRQTGKSTYFKQLAIVLRKDGYKVAHINFENYRNAPLETFLERFTGEINKFWNTNYQITNISKIFYDIEEIRNQKYVLIIDEVEGISNEYFGDFLHSIRNAYHSRENHSLKSVILVGVSNIVGVVSDNASPFNITDNLNVPYFTNNEVFELLGQHENETGQKFKEKVKNKICQITANQPGLVNGFAKKLVDDYPDTKILTYDNYLKVEDWYLRIAIDKNFSNILNKAKEQRNFVERLLFTEDRIPFKIDRESIKLLHTNGLIKDNGNGFVTFWVPFYRKRLYDAFYPYSNGEKSSILRSIAVSELFDENDKLILDKLILGYKEFVKRRGFNVFREKDEAGNYKSIKESALIYSFETYIQAFLQVVDGKSYREADTGLGKSDLIINVKSDEYLIESKIYYYESQFVNGKKQLAYYCKSLGLAKGVYLVFCPTGVKYPETIKEQNELIADINISTYLVSYDETTW
ncbi:MAG: AAA-like domain-containing protein [Bacteroidota bacterium]|nr:AAA-like domain-containing protein [Bacteroidota bacterium]